MSPEWIYYVTVAFFFIAIAALGEHYGMVSTLAEKRGINYAKYVILPFEKNIKVRPWFIWPYMAHFPLLFFGYMAALALAIEKEAVVLLMVGALVLDILSFALFWLFPVKVTPSLGGLYDPSSLAAGKTRQLIQNTNQSMPLFNSIPSLHVSQGLWLGFVLFETSAPLWLYVPYTLWFVSMCLATVILKYHAILDGVAGILIAIAAYYFAASLDLPAIKAFMHTMPCLIMLLIVDMVLLYSARKHSALLKALLDRPSQAKSADDSKDIESPPSAAAS